MVARAEDADGALDRRLADAGEARRLADDVDSGRDTSPASIALRSRVLTFYVDRNPYLDFVAPDFFPRPPEYNGGEVATSPDRTLRLSYYATDPDPLDPIAHPPHPGGPSHSTVLRYTTSITGKNAEGRDTTWLGPPIVTGRQLLQTVDLAAEAPFLVGNDLTLALELCDCAFCEAIPGTGRCVRYEIPVQVVPLTATLAALIAAEAEPERVRVRWALGRAGSARVERRSTESGWQTLGEVSADGMRRATYEDRSVRPGARYGYRLAFAPDPVQVAGEVWVDVPRRYAFALQGARPNPVVGDAAVAFALPDDRGAVLELYDAAGRRVWSKRLVAGPGTHVVPIESALAPGVYLLRLEHGGRALSTRVAIVR
jgi:hypothetical protein